MVTFIKGSQIYPEGTKLQCFQEMSFENGQWKVTKQWNRFVSDKVTTLRKKKVVDEKVKQDLKELQNLNIKSSEF